jgi:ferric-dicitrate binding protein FerR (iron transport regulator)
MKKVTIDKYKDYSVKEFVLDVDFIAWSKGLPDANENFWEEFLEKYPARKSTVATAKSFIQHVSIKEDMPSQEQLKRMWQHIQQSTSSRKSIIRRLSLLKAAAIFIVLIGAATVAYLTLQKEKNISTKYAEVKSIELPDHSKITLNANSSIHYAKHWDANKPREVWLTGEAFFEVNHLNKKGTAIQPGERFIVHANDVDVEVLGTTFNVNNRHEIAKVVLASGSIQLKFEDRALQNILMKPGDFVQYTKASHNVSKQTSNPLNVIAWKDKHWAFDNTSFKEILQLLKDDYGFDSEVHDDVLWTQITSGNISSDNEELVLRGLETLLGVKIEQQGKKLIFKK